MSTWFQDTIEEAIKIARSKNAIFVVYIEDSEHVTALHRIIESCDVQRLLTQPNFVCVRISSNSNSYRDFTNIYQLVPVPSVFFIGNEGWPLEIISGELSEHDIIKRIKSLMSPKTSLSLESTDTLPTCDGQLNEQTASDSVPNEEEIASVSNEEEKSFVPDEEKSKDSCDLNTKAKKKILDQSSTTSVNLQQNEETWNESISSTSSAHSFLPATPPPSLASLTSQTSIETVRVRDPGASYSAAPTGSSILSQAAKRLQEHMENQASPIRELAGRTSETTEFSRIQFRLPDGSSHMHNFPCETTIGDVRVYVRNNINLPYRDFSMSTGYPRFELSNPEQTLVKLNMMPTAVILINPVVSSSSPTYMSLFRDTLMFILAHPLSAMNGAFNYLYQRLFGNAIDQSGESVAPEDDDSQHANPINQNRSSVRHRRSVHREGNIHRLSNRTDDSDDDNNTWNGNSTQQM